MFYWAEYSMELYVKIILFLSRRKVLAAGCLFCTSGGASCCSVQPTECSAAHWSTRDIKRKKSAAKTSILWNFSQIHMDRCQRSKFKESLLLLHFSYFKFNCRLKMFSLRACVYTKFTQWIEFCLLKFHHRKMECITGHIFI